VRYQAGVLDVDFKETLINYLVEKNIMLLHEANWDEIVDNPLFHGTTTTYILTTYHGVQLSTWKKYRNISKSEMTSVVLQKYL